MTTLQHQQHPMSALMDGYIADRSDSASLEHSPVLQAFALNPSAGLIENRSATSCLPPSPLRTTFNPNQPVGTGVFNFNNFQTVDQAFENQLLQRLQALGPYQYQTYPQNYLLNNNYTLQPPPQKKLTHSPLAVRQNYGGSPVSDRRLSPAEEAQQKLIRQSQQRLQQEEEVAALERSFIKPLSQIGTLTTTDADGRVRVIVPVPGAGSQSTGEDMNNLLSALRLEEGFRSLNGPAITRSTSEKVPNRSELMSQVQRTAWARHTTK